MSNKTTGIPAIDCTLTGGYLIEASAGTGKTWTLTGIILRLLIEHKYAPERIIATTFTKAAAAEMQERIYERLQSFYGLMRWLKSVQTQHPHWFVADEENIDTIIQEINEYASDAQVAGDDPINQYLLTNLLLAGGHAIDESLRRTALVLTTLDKLFVGTLDSLAQKWLREFSSQIGHRSDSEILMDKSAVIHALVHDQLRAHQSRLSKHQPDIYQQILSVSPSFFSNVEQFAQFVNTAINFYSAPLDKIKPINIVDTAVIECWLDEFLAVDLSQFAPFFDAEYRRQVGIGGTKSLPKQLPLLAELYDKLSAHRLDFVHHLTKQEIAFIDEIEKFSQVDFFNKTCDTTAKATFIGLPWDRVTLVKTIYNTLNTQAKYHYDLLKYDIINSVREQLMSVLESQGQTTFELQMVRLNQALDADEGLAEHIRHHYPVALIDESQDINGLQAQMIEKIYLSRLFNYEDKLNTYHKYGGDKPKPVKGFLLLVGDPKQAIYRFRGGDVANYNWLKFYGEDKLGHPVLNQSLSLTQNRRSNQALIGALNEWFVKGNTDDWSNHANLGQSISYETIEAVNETQRLSWQQGSPQAEFIGRMPMSLLHTASDIAEKTALHINSLLQQGYHIDGRLVQPSDIAVLARGHKQLAEVKKCLDELKIPALNTKTISVFATPAGDDLHTLLLAVIDSRSTANLGRLLVGRLVGMSLDDAVRLLDGDADSEMTSSDASFNKSDILSYLHKIHDKWQNHSLSSALNYALGKAPFTDGGNLWLVAASLGERYLADLWQLIELLSAQSDLHEKQLLTWYQSQRHSEDESVGRRILPSETGVNLMTMHKSKGLEFPIVYALGLDASAVATVHGEKIYPYSNERFERCISTVMYKDNDDDYFKNLDNQEGIAEMRRLGYVALTRASEQIFIVAKVAGRNSSIDSRPLFQWLECSPKTPQLPERMTSLMDEINLDEVILNDAIYKQSQTHELIPLTYQDWDTLLPIKRFVGAYKTSFTALVSRLDKPTKDLLTELADHDEMAVLTELQADVQAVDGHEINIRNSFIKGSRAGDFLHKVLQHIEPNRISGVVDDFVRRLSLPSKYNSQSQLKDGINDKGEHDQLVMWLNDVIHAPFAASGVSLASLASGVQVRELGFTLGLKPSFDIDKLNEVFKQYSDKPLSLSTQEHQAVWYRFMRGEIDLVYEHAGRFFIVDYKSNYLGDSRDDYHLDKMNEAMSEAGYWLQAVIYQVALHRLLKIKLADYTGNEQRYLGAVEYFFLRGIYNDDADMGKMVWQPPFELIMAVDALFG
ncbi:UvrD-helicase domain-containing protein [Moraxella pluranimalium]|uniref:RecBCD enzyme subunit RecB n=1 Tax=Moraxella pluranimalium TaxID=470453 RepID=A0A1T0CQU3_9GAMM|nr:UvrD-helicase domain-containing protein [Moraxella pluranimalium]OOS24599.1 hypothetical protein B0680_03995 [Moraxella pluranimalium]